MPSCSQGFHTRVRSAMPCCCSGLFLYVICSVLLLFVMAVLNNAIDVPFRTKVAHFYFVADFFYLFLFLLYFVFIGFTFNACSLLHTRRSENKTRSTKNRIAWKCERDTLKLETKCHDAMHMFCIIFLNVSVSVTCECVCIWCERKR